MAAASLKQKLFGFHGRLRRQDWWVLGFAVAFFQFAVMVSAQLLVFGPTEPFLGTVRYAESGPAALPLWWVATGIGALCLWPRLALDVKRGHDIGWSAALTTGLCLVGFLASLAPSDFGAVLGGQIDAGRIEISVPPALFAAGMVVNLVLIVALGFVDGPQDANRYGPSPKSHSADASK